jgi:S1-C subfamily serine protease
MIKLLTKRINLLFIVVMFFSDLNSQSIRSVNLNQYKYIVIDEISGNYRREARKDVVKILQKAGYDVVNLSKPFKTYEEYPADLKENNNLGLYLSLNRVAFFDKFYVEIHLRNNDNQTMLERNGSSSSSTRSVKKALSSLTDYNYQYDSTINPSVNREVRANKIDSNSWLANGTGFFIDSRGYIATNYHVVENASAIQIEFNSKGAKHVYKATLIKADIQNDLAIVRINSDEFAPVDKIPYFIKSESAVLGSSVFTLGFPMALSLMGEDIKFTDGKISSKSGFLGNVNSYQISVPIQPGNSGGPLFDYDGNLIGITTATVNRQLDMTENVNYAVKSNYLLNLMDVMDFKSQIPKTDSLSKMTLTEKIRVLSDFVVIVKTR